MLITSSVMGRRNTVEGVFARLLLALLPMATLIGPRISLPIASSGDFRLQDFVLGFAVAFVVALGLVQRVIGRPILRSSCFLNAMVPLAIAFLLFGVVAVVSGPPDLFVLFYILRLAEPFVLVFLVSASVRVLGREGVILLVVGVAAGYVLNICWTLYQLVSGDLGPLWSLRRGYIEQYGPGLIGDPSTFPSAQTFAILLGGLVASQSIERLRTPPYRLMFASLVIISTTILVSTQSRISIASGFLILGIWLLSELLGIRKNLGNHAVGLILILFISVMVFLGVNLPRFGLGGVLADVERRIRDFYLPILAATESQMLFGLGPGHYRSENGNVEYHSTFFALFADFGLVGLLAAALGVSVVFRVAIGEVSSSPSEMVRFLGLWAILCIINLLFSGLLQDSYIAVTPVHLSAILLGGFFGIRSWQRYSEASLQKLASFPLSRRWWESPSSSVKLPTANRLTK